jgi:hypothetical protein
MRRVAWGLVGDKPSSALEPDDSLPAVATRSGNTRN